MIRFSYTLLIHIYKRCITLVALWNNKAKLRISGVRKLKTLLNDKDFSRDNNILIHCASQGEHEQALPIIRWIISNTNYIIVLSFYSPSGFNNTDYKYEPRVLKVYLPFDTPIEIGKFIHFIQPKFALIIKNEWWWNLLHELKKQKIDTFLISATIRNEHYFIKYPVQFFKDGLNAFSTIFVVDEDSKSIFSNVYDNKIIVSGDTRIDQTLYNKQAVQEKSKTINNLSDKLSDKVFVYGSIWQSDLDSINKLILIYPTATHLIYPHNLNEVNLQKLNYEIANSNIVSSTQESSQGINIISNMGELKYAYILADIAYIGGGFGIGIHNILEACVYNVPTIFGPKYKKSQEAKLLIDKRCAFTFESINELFQICETIDKEKNRKEIETNLKSYFSPTNSPNEIICREIFKKIDLNV